MTEWTPDQAEVDGIALGDEHTFHNVFKRYYEGLCNYAFTILKDADEGEDVVQSIFLKLWEQGKRFDADDKLKAYLFKSVYHRCINQLAHRTIRIKHHDQEKSQTPPVQQPEVFPDEVDEMVKAAINRLPLQGRTVFMMSRYEELRYSEIAQRLNISVNTVENQISKALKFLRAELKNIREIYGHQSNEK